MDVNLYLKAILKHKKLLTYWLIAGILIAVIAFFVQRPVYITKAKWYIQRASSNTTFTSSSGGEGSSEKSILTNIASSLFQGNSSMSTGLDAAVLQSPEIVREIIKRAKVKDKNGKLENVTSFRTRFIIKSDKSFPFILLTYSAHNPVEAFNVLKIAEEVFVEKNISAEAKKAELNRKFLEEQVKTASTDTEKSAQELKNYEKKAKIVNIEEEAKSQQERLLRFQNELANSKANLATVQSKVSDLKSKLRIHSTREAIEKSTIGSDFDINALKTQLVDKNNKLIALQVKYTDKHYTVVETKEEIDRLKKEIEKRQKILIGKSIPAENVEDVKSVKSMMIDDLVNLSTEEVSLNSRIGAIQDTLSKYNKDFSVLPSKKYNLSNLDFENEFNKNRFESLRLSFESAKLNEAFAKNTISIVKLDEPEMLKSPTFPNIFLNLIIGIVLGFVFGYTHIIIKESIDNRVRTEDQFEAISNYTYLGQINCKQNDNISSPQINIYDEANVHSDEYVKLRTNLRFLNVDNQVKNITFIYPEQSIYPAIALTNLAISFVKANNRVLLVETNIREPILHKILNLNEPANGLTNYIAGNVDNLESIVQHNSNVNNLFFLSAGTLPPSPSDILDSEKMRQFIRQLEDQYDLVLYNLPPFKAFADALIISNYLDGNILVANASLTTVNDILHTQKVLAKNNIKLLGSLFLNITS